MGRNPKLDITEAERAEWRDEDATLIRQAQILEVIVEETKRGLGWKSFPQERHRGVWVSRDVTDNSLDKPIFTKQDMRRMRKAHKP